MEEAITTHWKEGSESWNEENPLQGGRTFLDMAVVERVRLFYLISPPPPPSWVESFIVLSVLVAELRELIFDPS